MQRVTAANPRERGAVLLVGLILLTILMLGAVSLMDSSVMDERMAGNSRSSSNAFMAAEAGQYAAIDHVMGNWDSVRSNCSVDGDLSAVSGDFNAQLKSKYTVSYAACGANEISLRSEGQAGFNALRSIVFDVKNGLPQIKPPAAISCFGACTVDPGNAQKAPIDGRNHPLGPLSTCNIKNGNSHLTNAKKNDKDNGNGKGNGNGDSGGGSNSSKCPVTASSYPDDAVPAVYLTEYGKSELVPAPGGGANKDPFIGKTPTGTIVEGNSKSTASVWDNNPKKFAPAMPPAREEFFGPGSVVDNILRFSNPANSSDQLGSLDAPKITVIGQGASAVKESGNGTFSGYLVVKDGETYKLGGNTTYIGIIFLTGCSHLVVHGQPTIYGAVIVDAQGCGNESDGKPYKPFQGNGTPNLKYSFDALKNTSDHILGLVVDDWYEEIQP